MNTLRPLALTALAGLLTLAAALPALAESKVSGACSLTTSDGKTVTLKGKVQVVSSFADVKVQVVSSFPDLKVQTVTSFPDDCGKWQFVDSFPDFTITYVDSFPDVTIQMVESFPGLP